MLLRELVVRESWSSERAGCSRELAVVRESWLLERAGGC